MEKNEQINLINGFNEGGDSAHFCNMQLADTF